MDKVELKAYGKINLGLDVIQRREDGYHELSMVMQTVGLFDKLTLCKIPEDKIRLTTNFDFLPIDKNNLIYRAILTMKERYGIKEGVRAKLEKKIPVAAGMAGGSTDCAAALRGMNQLFCLGLSKEELCDIGVTLGADVPYCVVGGTVLAEGIGEKLTMLPPMPRCCILVAKPGISVSTKFVYNNLKLDENTFHPDIEGIVDSIKNEDLKGICDRLENVLETVTIPNYPVIQEIKEFLEEYGARKALMSGSGPTVFGIFTSKNTAYKALRAMRSIKEVKQAYVVDPVGREIIGGTKDEQ
ncbi:MAG: 4-(cytidine 5'-diphospho)-2-C-methyl-D-erythritol kinase [Anaerostipes sp.]|nr:4-(cytidine 5'-diphospho)-2-C-methyl-D-erythritol kinase [Anaerostipes sp.]